jgi:hypothetical protein
MTPRDAIVSFHCSLPDFVQVSEFIEGDRIQHQRVERHPDVVLEMEQKYMFFGEQASIARKKIMRGQSCTFNVYFREP